WQTLHSPPATDCALPFQGGWFLFLGYELAAQVEPVLRLPLAMGSQLPVACAVRAPAALIHDHREQTFWLVAEPGCESLLELMAADIGQSTPLLSVSKTPLVDHVREDDAGQYLNSVARIKQYILDGDVFQVNLSRAWRGALSSVSTDASLYRRLRAANPAPFAGLCAMDDWAVISSSPERLVAVHGDTIETRPIAGTAPRTVDTAVLEQRLMRHPKERAEHIMLIDLERNDLGRICVPGTVEVNELLALESYAYVHHLVSNVRGIKRAAVTPGEVIRAVFPGGTITGCPKVRCMEIIAELEGEARGAYTGALGYVNRDGSMDLNILIRTMVREGRRLSLRAGAGIVADSIPSRELAETRAKAQGMLAALAGEG
ncbi:MAG: aminodeoxychorismate synthase component I, partial [Gammaproteobacteria bacterium]